jgi:hypothetical protein
VKRRSFLRMVGLAPAAALLAPVAAKVGRMTPKVQPTSVQFIQDITSRTYSIVVDEVERGTITARAAQAVGFRRAAEVIVSPNKFTWERLPLR